MQHTSSFPIKSYLRDLRKQSSVYNTRMKTQTITLIGTGFVGVVSAAVYASFGNTVFGLDIDQKKIATLQKSSVPFYEPDLEELLKKTQKNGKLHFTTSYKEAVEQADIVMIAVGTPSQPDGSADLKYVMAAAESLAPHLRSGAVVVVKSTVPPGTLEMVSKQIGKYTKVEYSIASVPEFLREGSAVADTLHPDRVVIGAANDAAFEKLRLLHEPLKAPIVRVAPESAQMAKYTANAYLATRITFINQIADLCEQNGADIQEIIAAIGYDKRIGSHYWYPGLGYGGSCFPKDVNELAAYSRKVGKADNLFNKIAQINSTRIPALLEEYETLVGGFANKTVAVLGLAFKPNTDDMREAPSMHVVPALLKKGAKIQGFDPKALEAAEQYLPKDPKLTYAKSVKEACKNADCILILIEWPEITSFDYSTVRSKAKTQYFIDTRNQFSQEIVTQWGFVYKGVGR